MHDVNIIHMTHAEMRSGMLDGSLKLYSKRLDIGDVDSASMILLGVAGFMYGDLWGLRGNVHYAILGETSVINWTDSFARRLASDKIASLSNAQGAAANQHVIRRERPAPCWGYPHVGCDLESVLGTTTIGSRRVSIVDVCAGVARCGVELKEDMIEPFGPVLTHMVQMVSALRVQSVRLVNSQSSVPRAWLKDALPTVFESCSPIIRDSMGGLFKIGTIPSDMRNSIDHVMEWFRINEEYLVWNRRSRWFEVDDTMRHAQLPPGRLETLDVMLSRVNDPVGNDEARMYLERYARDLTVDRLMELRRKSGSRLEFTECDGYRWRISESGR